MTKFSFKKRATLLPITTAINSNFGTVIYCGGATSFGRTQTN